MGGWFSEKRPRFPLVYSRSQTKPPHKPVVCCCLALDYCDWGQHWVKKIAIDLVV